MDSSLAVASDEGDLPWSSDSNSMDSDDGHDEDHFHGHAGHGLHDGQGQHDGLDDDHVGHNHNHNNHNTNSHNSNNGHHGHQLNQHHPNPQAHPHPHHHLLGGHSPVWIHSRSTSSLEAGQLSPISTGMDNPLGSHSGAGNDDDGGSTSSVMTGGAASIGGTASSSSLAHSASSSSCNDDGWPGAVGPSGVGSSSRVGNRDYGSLDNDDLDGDHDDGASNPWAVAADQSSDDDLAVTKQEALDDDDVHLDDYDDVPVTPTTLLGMEPSSLSSSGSLQHHFMPPHSSSSAANPSALLPAAAKSEGPGNLDGMAGSVQPIAVPGEAKVKRGRGRPRKYPPAPTAPPNKVVKGRSKTGCITCRKRKKKCDEAKPRCMNCEKNAVVCEGYNAKQLWKSGKERAEDARVDAFSSLTMQPIVTGIETAEDRIFWKHYLDNLSAVLTVEGEHKNAFRDIIMPLAIKHRALMHAILSLSSQHIDFDTPYGRKFLQDNPTTHLGLLQQRSAFHHDKARGWLFESDNELGRHKQQNPVQYQMELQAQYGTILCFLLETMAAGIADGEHRLHLKLYQKLIQENPPEDENFRNFIVEFFQYHIYADDFIRHPDTGLQGEHLQRSESDVMDTINQWNPPRPEQQPQAQDSRLHPPRLMGVNDGLFKNLAVITYIRNMARLKLERGLEPAVDYRCFFIFADMEQSVFRWHPQWPAGDSRRDVTELYKAMMWVHFFRTMYPPEPAAVEAARVKRVQREAGNAGGPSHEDESSNNDDNDNAADDDDINDASQLPLSVHCQTPPLSTHSSASSAVSSPDLLAFAAAGGGDPSSSSLPPVVDGYVYHNGQQFYNTAAQQQQHHHQHHHHDNDQFMDEDFDDDSGSGNNNDDGLGQPHPDVAIAIKTNTSPVPSPATSSSTMADPFMSGMTSRASPITTTSHHHHPHHGQQHHPHPHPHPHPRPHQHQPQHQQHVRFHPVHPPPPPPTRTNTNLSVHSDASSQHRHQHASAQQQPQGVFDRSGSSSPPPILRGPAGLAGNMEEHVEKFLAILEQLKPSDPVQTLLLMPCLVVGCACFSQSQRTRLAAGIRTVKGYTGLRNCDRAMELLNRVWSLMDQGEWVRVWDWQSVAREMNLDFLAT